MSFLVCMTDTEIVALYLHAHIPVVHFWCINDIVQI